MEDLNKIDASIILPVFNEAKILRSSVLAVRAAMAQTRYEYEIIIAEDASTDGTGKLAEELVREFGNVVHLKREKRYGRGSAVANAILRSRGSVCGYLDADLETPAHYIPVFISEIEKGADIASAERIYKMDWRRKILRLHKLLAHTIYARISKMALKVSLKDIESGCKFFRKDRIVPVLAEIKDTHWFWDTEVMVRPYYKGYIIKEVPVVFTVDLEHETKVSLIKDSISHLRNLIKFRKEIKAEFWGEKNI